MAAVCERCSTFLKVDYGVSPPGVLHIQVEPCPHCARAEYEEGQRDGFDRGFNEGYSTAERELDR